MRHMARNVKRSYDGAGRRAQSEATRQRIIDTARSLMLERGYRRTSVADIAAAASVNVDTLYQLVGRKASILREIVEQAISGEDHAVPAEERDYVVAVRAEPDARQKLRIYASAVRRTQHRLAPIVRVILEAAPSEPGVAALWHEITERRAANMRTFIADLAQASPLRDGLSQDKAADIVWTLNSTDVYLLMTSDRGWSPEEFEEWLGDAWERLLLP